MKGLVGCLFLVFIAASCGDSEKKEVKDVIQDISSVEPSEETVNEENDEPDDLVMAEETKPKKFTIEDYASLDTRQKLSIQFGREHLVDGESWYAEGTVKFEHTILNNPLDTVVVKFCWRESNRDSLSFVEVNHLVYNEEYEVQNKQVVYSNSGVYLGMPLTELHDWNGANVNFSGFGWDYAGGVFKSEGKLKDEVFGLTLDIDYTTANTGYYGDMELNSGVDSVRNAPIFVGQLMLSPSN